MVKIMEDGGKKKRVAKFFDAFIRRFDSDPESGPVPHSHSGISESGKCGH